MSTPNLTEPFRLLPTPAERYTMTHPQHPGDGSAARFEPLSHDSIAYRKHYSVQQVTDEPWSLTDTPLLHHE
jgi:hypothetical protein